MAVLAIINGVGITKPMYESLRREVKWETKIEPGALLHVCAFDDRGNSCGGRLGIRRSHE